MIGRTKTISKSFNQNNSKYLLLDLTIYISVMFLVREIYLPNVGFLANGLFWSFSTLVVASWRMRVRGVTWSELGLCKPKNFTKTLIVAAAILAAVVISMIIFEVLKDQLPFSLAPDTSNESAVSKFGDLKGNFTLFFSIIGLVLIESFLEELLDRGFLMNWFERFFSKVPWNTIIAVILQAVIFGFRHSYDLSERSITAGIIALIMGTAYMAFGRNLWPLIIAHCALNTISMLGRVI